MGSRVLPKKCVNLIPSYNIIEDQWNVFNISRDVTAILTNFQVLALLCKMVVSLESLKLLIFPWKFSTAMSLVFPEIKLRSDGNVFNTTHQRLKQYTPVSIPVTQNFRNKKKIETSKRRVKICITV